MTDEENCPLVLAEQLLQQIERFDVEVVGRLVEHDQVRRGRESDGERQSAALASRQLIDRGPRLLGAEQKILHVADDVAALSVDGHVVAAAAGESVDQRRGGLQRRALLIEPRHGHVRSDVNIPGVGSQRSGKEIDQGGLSGAVGADDPDSVSPHDPEREVANDRSATKGFADPLGLDHERPGWFGILRDHAGEPGRPARLASLPAQAFELRDATHVALAPRRDAVTHPVFFVDDAPVELVPLRLLLFQLHVAPRLEGAEAAIETVRLSAIDPDGRVGQVRHQAFVVADERDRRAAFRKMALEPLDRDQVEVVGRFVEQQDFGFRAQDPHEGRASRFAAGQGRRVGGGIDPEFGHHHPRRVDIVVFAHTRQNIVQRRGEAGHIRLLRQEGQPGRRLLESRAAIRRREPRRDPHQRRLPRSVPADERDPVAGRNRQLRLLEQGSAAERQANVTHLQQGRHVPFPIRGRQR